MWNYVVLRSAAPGHLGCPARQEIALQETNPTFEEWQEDWFLSAFTDGVRQHDTISPKLLAQFEGRQEREERQALATWRGQVSRSGSRAAAIHERLNRLLGEYR